MKKILYAIDKGRRQNVVGFLGYPQPGGGAHPPISSEGGLGEVLGG